MELDVSLLITRTEDEENEHYERLCRGEKLRVSC